MNYNETLNTLKYAERAKKVKNVAVVNESAQDKMIRELTEENDNLKKLLMAAAKGGTIDLSNPDLLASLGKLGIESSPGENNPAEEIKEKLEDNEKEMKNMEISWKEKLEEEKKLEEEREIQDKSNPHLTNLNEDPQLTGMLYYNLLEAPFYVGRKTGNPLPTIIIGGIGILSNHCSFEIEKSEEVRKSPTLKIYFSLNSRIRISLDFRILGWIFNIVVILDLSLFLMRNEGIYTLI